MELIILTLTLIGEFIGLIPTKKTPFRGNARDGKNN